MQFAYDYYNAKIESMEERIKKIENIGPFYYISELNKTTKEKLIEICFNKKFQKFLKKEVIS